MSLKNRTASALVWTFSQQFSVQGINFIVSIILSRILLPAEFGLVGMLTVFIGIGNALIDSGLTSSLIRTPNLDQTDYSTAFFINLIGSIVIYIVLFLAAPYIAIFYHQSILTNLIRVYTLSFIISAFETVQRTKLTKELNFKLQMVIQLPSIITSSILGIVLAKIGFGVWALVWMNLLQVLLATCQLWIRSGWKPSFIFDKNKFKYHFGFGYKIAMSGLLDTVYENIYNIIIGKFFSVTELGYYTRAWTFKQVPVQSISAALNKVTYPVFSSIQGDDIKLKSAYKKLMQQVLFWVAPLLTAAAVLAESIFRFLLSEKWVPAVPYFQILCISGIMYPLHAYNLNILNVKGRSDLFFKLEVIKKIVITIGILAAIPFGIFGLLYLQVVLAFLLFIVNTWYSGKMINYPLYEQIKDLGPILLVSLFAGLIAYLINYYLNSALQLFDVTKILLIYICYFLIYLIASKYIRISALYEFRQLILRK